MATWTVTDPAGVTHTKTSKTRVYKWALIRRNIGSDNYFVNWSTSLAGVKAESRVFATQRDYITIIPLMASNQVEQG